MAVLLLPFLDLGEVLATTGDLVEKNGLKPLKVLLVASLEHGDEARALLEEVGVLFALGKVKSRPIGIPLQAVAQLGVYGEKVLLPLKSVLEVVLREEGNELRRDSSLGQRGGHV